MLRSSVPYRARIASVFWYSSWAFRELLDEAHLNVEADRQVWVLVRGVHGAANVEVDVRGLLKEHPRNARSAVLLIAPVRIALVVL